MSDTTQANMDKAAQQWLKAREIIVTALIEMPLRPCGRYEERAAAILARLAHAELILCSGEELDEADKLRNLVHHCWVHSGFKDCGRSQMTTEQIAIYEQTIKAEREKWA